MLCCTFLNDIVDAPTLCFALRCETIIHSTVHLIYPPQQRNPPTSLDRLTRLHQQLLHFDSLHIIRYFNVNLQLHRF